MSRKIENLNRWFFEPKLWIYEHLNFRVETLNFYIFKFKFKSLFRIELTFKDQKTLPHFYKKYYLQIFWHFCWFSEFHSKSLLLWGVFAYLWSLRISINPWGTDNGILGTGWAPNKRNSVYNRFLLKKHGITDFFPSDFQFDLTCVCVYVMFRKVPWSWPQKRFFDQKCHFYHFYRKLRKRPLALINNQHSFIIFSCDLNLVTFISTLNFRAEKTENIIVLLERKHSQSFEPENRTYKFFVPKIEFLYFRAGR